MFGFPPIENSAQYILYHSLMLYFGPKVDECPFANYIYHQVLDALDHYSLKEKIIKLNADINDYNERKIALMDDEEYESSVPSRPEVMLK